MDRRDSDLFESLTHPSPTSLHRPTLSEHSSSILSSAPSSDDESPPVVRDGKEPCPRPHSHRARRKPPIYECTKQSDLNDKAAEVLKHMKYLNLNWVDLFHYAVNRDKQTGQRFLGQLETKPNGQAIIAAIDEHRGRDAVSKSCNWSYEVYRREIRSLAKSDICGAWKASDLEDRNNKSMIQSMTGWLAEAEMLAPRFVGLLRCVSNSRPTFRREDHPARWMLILSALCFVRNARSCNKWPTVWALQMYEDGARRSLIDLLHRLGVSISYSTTFSIINSISPRPVPDPQELVSSGTNGSGLGNPIGSIALNSGGVEVLEARPEIENPTP